MAEKLSVRVSQMSQAYSLRVILTLPQPTSTTENDKPCSFWKRFTESFKRFDVQEMGLDPDMSDIEKAAFATACLPLCRSLKGRHLQMIAIGGTIGTGLFIGSSEALIVGGPASVFIAYILVGSMMYCTIQALGELAVVFPVAGAFVTYNTRFIDPSWGFAMAWNYAMQWLVIMPLELVAAAIAIQYWDVTYNPAAFCAFFYTLIIIINFFGVKGYGEAEFVFSILKVLAVVGFIILGIVLVLGGGPKGGFIGGKYWRNPGAFSNGFQGVCTVFVIAAFSFGGTELIGLATAECANPRKSMPRAIKQVLWRIILFYIVSLTLVGLLVPFNDPSLKNNDGTARSSPFVIAINNAGIRGLPSVMNVVIIISILSVANSSVYGSSRTLAALGAAGQAPKFFSYIDRKGRPIFGLLVQALFGLMCFSSATGKEAAVFKWLLALSGSSLFFTWASICVCHIRFRQALFVQNRGVDELVYTSQTGVFGSYYGLVMNVFMLAVQIWVAAKPVGGEPDVLTFFQSCLSIPIVIVSYLGHKIWKKNWILYVRANELDIDTGRRDLDVELLKQEIAEEAAALKEMPIYRRIFRWFC